MNKQGKILIGLSIAAVGLTTFIVWRRSVNKKNATLLLEYIATIPVTNTTQGFNEAVDKATGAVQGATDTTNVKDLIKGNPVIFDGRVFTDPRTAINAGIPSTIAHDLNKAMSSINPLDGGTDMREFESAFNRIGSKNALILVNAIYKSSYGETLWEAIKGESRLYYGKGVLNSIESMLTSLPNFNPVVSKVLLNLK